MTILLQVIKQLLIDTLSQRIEEIKNKISSKENGSWSLFKLAPYNTNLAVASNWLSAYHIEALGADYTSPKFADTIDIDVQNTLKLQNEWVLMCEEVPAFLCGFNAELPDAVQIWPVFTPIQFRNKGYARVLLYLSLQQEKNNQINKAILFTNDDYASRVYTSLGFAKIVKYRLAILKD